jgi:PAS domain S-box-containing protein
MSEVTTSAPVGSGAMLRGLSRALFPFLHQPDLSDEEIRTRLFVSIVSFAGTPALLYFGLRNFGVGNAVLVWLELFCAGLCVAMYFAARVRSVRLLPRVVLVVAIVIVAYAHTSPSGGITLIWPVLFPVLVTFVYGGREGLLWSVGLFAFWWTLFTHPEWLGVVPDSDYWPDAGETADFFFCYLLIVLVTLGYEALRTNAMSLADARQTRLAEALERLRHGEQRLRDFADTASDWLFELDEELRISWVSSRWKVLTGRQPEDILGQSILAFVEGPFFDDAEEVRTRLERHEPVRNVRQRIARPDGSLLHVSVRADPVLDEHGRFLGYRGASQDVTERERAAEVMREKDRALVQASKMEAVGQLTSGVAHDFNNLLTVIVGNLELLGMRLEDAGIDDEELAQAMAASQRAADLTSKLLAFSRRQSLTPVVVDPAPMLEGMVALLRRTLGEAVTVTVDTAPETWPCEVDRSQLENALLNLAINGRDAMTEGGDLRIEASGRTLTAEEGAPLQLPAGDYVSFRVTDSGGGMPPELLEHVFEPFFSTKPQGRGTGLGLSMVYGFVRQSGGGVRIDSALGEGTTVELLLPRASGAQEERAAAGRAVPRSGAGVRVLLVEDEAGVRELVRSMLQRLGYSCDAAETIDEALALHAREGHELVVSDVVLACGESGIDLVRTLRERAPGVRALFISGYSEEAFRSRAPLEDPVELLPKPFGLAELGARLEALLRD